MAVKVFGEILRGGRGIGAQIEIGIMIVIRSGIGIETEISLEIVIKTGKEYTTVDMIIVEQGMFLWIEIEIEVRTETRRVMSNKILGNGTGNGKETVN